MTASAPAAKEAQEAYDDALHERADDFVSGLDRGERVIWLQRQGVADLTILDALLDDDDPDLDEFCRDTAHGVAADVANGALYPEPSWLQ